MLAMCERQKAVALGALVGGGVPMVKLGGALGLLAKPDLPHVLARRVVMLL